MPYFELFLTQVAFSLQVGVVILTFKGFTLQNIYVLVSYSTMSLLKRMFTFIFVTFSSVS